jgi:hypothetical protein
MFSRFLSTALALLFVSTTVFSQTSYADLLARVKSNGQIPDSSIIYLMKTARETKDTSGRRIVARYYIDAIEKSARGVQDFNSEVLRHVAEFVGSDDKKLFSFFYKDFLKADAFFQMKGVAKNVVKNVMTNEEINAYIVESNDYARPKTQKPDWNKIAKRIDRKYGKGYSEELILIAQRNWYKKSQRDWNRLAEAHITYFKRFRIGSGVIEMASMNNQLWEDVFMHVEDKVLLKEAADLMLGVIKMDAMRHAGYIDTYANLLYKSGDVEAAKLWQSKAVEKRPDMKDYVDNEKKMKEGLPTWPSR